MTSASFLAFHWKQGPPHMHLTLVWWFSEWQFKHNFQLSLLPSFFLKTWRQAAVCEAAWSQMTNLTTRVSSWFWLSCSLLKKAVNLSNDKMWKSVRRQGHKKSETAHSIVWIHTADAWDNPLGPKSEQDLTLAAQERIQSPNATKNQWADTHFVSEMFF